ncbi:MAG: hypothetical protein ACREXW_08045 [Gammaproteobacteria bacterium]
MSGPYPTINNTRDFGIGKQLKNLPALRQIGFKANRRLLDVQTISHDCSIGEEAFEKVVRPIEVEGQRASALRCGEGRVQALFSVLVLFSLQTGGFTNSDMRALLAQLLGLDPAHYPQGRMSYDLRRLRLHGLIERIPHSHRYEPTALGLRVALFFSRTYNPAPPTYPRRHRSQRTTHPLPYSRCLREASNPHRPSLSGGTTRHRINLTHLHHIS